MLPKMHVRGGIGDIGDGAIVACCALLNMWVRSDDCGRMELNRS